MVTYPRKVKIEKGLKKYNIESSDFADFRARFYGNLSAGAHGNENTFFTLTRTPEENLSLMSTMFTISIAHFDTTLKSALE